MTPLTANFGDLLRWQRAMDEDGREGSLTWL